MPRHRLVDLSRPLGADTPPWPGNPPTRVTVLDVIPADRSPDVRGESGSPGHVNATCVDTCNHTGTHMDAPAHFRGDGRTIDQVPLEQCVGRCTLVRLATPCPPDRVLVIDDFRPFAESLASTCKLVVDTGWARRWDDPDLYFTRFPTLDEAAARWLVGRGVELVGLDSPSVDHAPHDVHHILLGAGAVIVENLANLEAVDGPEFELIVTPLPLVGLEASPVRAVARF